MRAALYIRVSTEEQANEGYSINAQRERLTAYCHSQEWELYDYYMDEGFSAKDTNRPALQRMLNDVKERKFDVVLVHKLDRFTRKVKDLYGMLEDFDKYKVGFRSAQEQFDTTTPMGRAMMGMLGIFAQWERETIAERVYYGIEQMVQEGKQPGGNDPLGYRRVDGQLVIVPNEAEFVRRLYRLYMDRNGMPAITKILAEEGIHMSINTIHYILRNPTYCGKIRWNHRRDGNRTGKDIIVDGTHEPIISVEEFEQVQKLRLTRSIGGRKSTSDFPFTGVLKCAKCGHHLVGSSRVRDQGRGGRERFYRCSGKIQYGVCDMPNIAEHKVDKEFVRVLNVDKKELSRLITVPQQPKGKDRIEELKRELELIAARKKRWQLAFANGLIELDELRQLTEPDKLREAEIKEQLTVLPQVRRPSFSKEEFIHQLIQLREIWSQITDYRAKKDFIEDLFESITIQTDAKPSKQKFNIEIVEWTLK